MNLCQVPFIDQRILDKETLEGMVDGMTLKGVLSLLEEIAYEKAQHIEENWQDRALAREWERMGWKIGRWIEQL